MTFDSLNINKDFWSLTSLKNKNISFPLERFYSLLLELDWQPSEWIDFWRNHNSVKTLSSLLPAGTKADWIWGICIPLLSDINKNLLRNKKRKIYGISALPGCGKTSLGRWLEAAGKELNVSIKVISLDDFYLPGIELDKAMQGNPWGVPRGLPGSHSISLLEQSLDIWLSSGFLKAPKFDKALRNGCGDRSGFLECNPDLLVLEGWFLGCCPINNDFSEAISNDSLSITLTEKEKLYRERIQKILIQYLSIWNRIHRIWHIKPIDYSSTCQWKIEQEKEMLLKRGAALKGDSLKSFVRMIQCSLPEESLMNIDADVVVEINNQRDVINFGYQTSRKKLKNFAKSS